MTVADAGTARRADEAVAKLVAAQQERTEIEPLVDDWPDLDERTAYDLQHRVVAKLVADESTRVHGLKLGLTSVAKQQQMSVHEPIYGVLIGSRLHPEGEALEIGSLIHPKIEPEIAVTLKHALRGPGVTRDQAKAAVGAAYVAMEVIDSRYRNFRFGLADVVADNTSAARYLVAARPVPVDDLDLRTLGVVFERDGEVVSTAAGAAVLGDPYLALAWLANKVAEHGNESLDAGSLILTGALTDAVSVVSGSVVRVEIARLGSLSVRCI